mmetsp:Transcript_40752/g.95704  ORF Transcript_40752/g.95704 Transcript_40752/m.95704 type:complete len:375 (+) Transcript_40752:116-1240(+)
MASATPRVSALACALLVSAGIFCLSQLHCFVTSASPSHGGASPLVQTPSPRTQNFQNLEQTVGAAASSGEALAGAAVAAGLLTFVASGAAKRGLAARRVANGAPSLVQFLEQKKLLSTVQNLRLLSSAEAAGIKGSTLEKLGLLKLAQDLKLLSTAETLVTDGKTPFLLLSLGSILCYGAYLDLTLLPADFFQGFVAGLLGVPGLILLLAGVALGVLTAGARRTADISLTEKTVKLLPGLEKPGGRAFDFVEEGRDQTLLQTLEDKQLLSLAEELKLLSLAEGVVGKPLTFAERTGILSLLESGGLLTLVESLAAKKTVAGALGIAGLTIVFAAAPVFLFAGLVPALLLILGGIVLIGGGLAFSVVQAPERSVR